MPPKPASVPILGWGHTGPCPPGCTCYANRVAVPMPTPAASPDPKLAATACSPDHETPAGGENIPGITIEDNQHEDCFSIRYVDPVDGEHDVIHFCDWPALRAAIDQHQRERGGRT